MIIFFLQILCSFLISMSLVFIIIQIKAKFDKSFLIFGISNLLLCSFSAIDIWLQPTTQILHWTRLQHVMASFFPPFIMWYLMLAIRMEILNVIRIQFIIATLISLIFFTDGMLIQLGEEVIGSIYYNVIFAPYMLISIFLIIKISIASIKKSSTFQRRFLFLHLIGVMILAISGIADMTGVLNGARLITIIPCFTIIGILCFSFIINMLFIEKLAGIIAEREETFKKLRNAYRELEEVQVLKELGQSTAMINHEIRNYAVAISGYAELLLMKGELNEFAKKMANRIIDSITRMTNFSKDILEFSKASVIKKNASINLVNVIQKCIANNFEKSSSKFVLNFTSSKQFIINGDWHKLDQVFVNLIKNAFEAGAEHINIRLKQSRFTVQCQISDDGVGCSDDTLVNLFKAFNTTKKETGGTGLGLCVVKSIIEGHGGRISAFSKMHTIGSPGLGVNIVFPKYSEEIEKNIDEKNGIIFITHGIKKMSLPIIIFRNALVNPYMFNSVKEIDADTNFKKIYSVIGIAESIHQFKTRFKKEIIFYALVEDAHEGLFILDELGEDNPILFTEEYLLSKIVIREYESEFNTEVVSIKNI